MSDGIRNRFVCLLDILGFSDLIENEKLNEISDFFKSFHDAVDWYTKWLGLHMPNGPFKSTHHIDINYRIFSDTIVLFTDGDTDEELLFLFMSASRIINTGFEHGLALRGAITFGECEVTKDILLGKPIVQAYKMEQAQEWAGCWLDKESLEPYILGDTWNTLRNIYFLKYQIPLKQGKVKDEWVLNWPIVDLGKYIDDKTIRDIFRNSDDWSVERKIINTQEFFKHIKPMLDAIKEGPPLKRLINRRGP